MSNNDLESYCEDSGTKESVPYAIVSKAGVKRSQFEAFTKTLPDQGEGNWTVVKSIDCLIYHTSLTHQRAQEIAEEPFVECVKLAGAIPKPDPRGPDVQTSEQNFDEDAWCEPSGSEGPVRYMIETESGTELETFESFIKTLPDGGKGYQMVGGDSQTYITTLTYEEAKEIAKEHFVSYAILADAPLETFEMIGGADTGQQDFDTRLTTEQHLRILSSPRPPRPGEPARESPNYNYDPALGRGQTVYILDKGFNIYHSEFRGSGRTWTTYVVPNPITLASVPDRHLWAEGDDLNDYDGHGTMVASVAIGKNYGVASNANFVLVKFQQVIRTPHNGSVQYVPATRAGLKDAWQFVVKDVLRRRQNGDVGKFIVNMSVGTLIVSTSVRHASLANTSQGFAYLPGWATDQRTHIEKMFRKALQECWNNDIITVVAAGNWGETLGASVEKLTPQNWGHPNNPLITVGGVKRDGALWPESSFDVGKGGSITVYAVAENVHGANAYRDGIPRVDSGTSFAAPAVAGLAAYFASLPSLAAEWRPGQVALDMKRYIAKHAVQRRNPSYNITELPLAYFTHPSPLAYIDPVKVAYNRAPDGLCSARKPPGDDPPPAPAYTGSMNRGRHSGNRGAAHRGRGRGRGRETAPASSFRGGRGGRH